jgi:hypothetical protein
MSVTSFDDRGPPSLPSIQQIRPGCTAGGAAGAGAGAGAGAVDRKPEYDQTTDTERLRDAAEQGLIVSLLW